MLILSLIKYLHKNKCFAMEAWKLREEILRDMRVPRYSSLFKALTWCLQFLFVLTRFRTYLECANFCGEFKGAVASVKIVGGSGSEGRPVSGYILLTQADEDSPVYIRGEIRGLEAVPHGFHIHEFGNTDGESQPCS